MRRRAMRRRGRRRRDERLGDRDGGVRSRFRSRVGGGEGGGARDGASLSSRRASSDASRDDGGPVLNRRDRARLVRGGGSGGGGGGGGGGGTSIDGRRGGWETRERTRRGGFDGARGRAAGDPRRVGQFGDGFVARDGIARRKRVGLRGHVSGASNERCAVDSRRLGGFRGERARGVGTGAGRGDAGGPVSGTRRVSTGGAGVGASIGPAGAAVLVAKDVGPPSFLMPKVLFTSRPNFPMAPTGGASWCSLGRLPGLRARSDVERNSRTWNVRVFTDASPGGERCAL